MSSMYTITPGIPDSRLSIARWKIPGADEIPKGRWLKQNNPQRVLMTVNCLDSSSNFNR